MADHDLSKCIPLGDRIVVKRDESQKQTKGGILLPDGGKRITGVILSVGPGGYYHGVLQKIDERLKPGVRIVLTGYAGMELTEGVSQVEEEFLIIRADDALAIVPE